MAAFWSKTLRENQDCENWNSLPEEEDVDVSLENDEYDKERSEDEIKS